VTSLKSGQIIYEVLCRPKHKPVTIKVELDDWGGGGWWGAGAGAQGGPWAGVVVGAWWGGVWEGKEKKCDVGFGLPTCL